MRDDTVNKGAKTNDDHILSMKLQSLLIIMESMELDIRNSSPKYTRHTILKITEKARRCVIEIKDLCGTWLKYFNDPITYAVAPASGRPFRPQKWLTRASEWTIFGEVAGTMIAALPDSGADACFVSPEVAVLLGLSPKPGSERPVKLANGRKIISPGSVDIPWRFLNEKETFRMTCWILPGCTHQIILGSKFLGETESLTTGRHRIQRKYTPVPKSVCVKLLGEGKQRLWGYLNDSFVAALPDTGSDVMIISLQYARRLNLKIDSGLRDIVEVEFADGSTCLTNGIVRDVAWSSGCHSIRCDFLVLDDISVDVILAKDYLFDMDVFSNCRNHLTEDEDIEQLYVYGIRLVREFGDRFGTALDQLEGGSIDDVTSQDAFSPAMINREWARRDKIRDEIEALDGSKRAEAERRTTATGTMGEG
ncbi:hypothetical protein O1611_g4401 [Lasiodiplodia mahajangana]|uniref:Uncharacterized protein n=1 Tax=Lasiodiplodia mahajangana TaxID=1108764 RepID=A0ACC2JP09_9PEZI|nr:hypothetical protein O1611_g4401 [Lasiodiplodia mahajangana]